jgi:hypothetical protein
MLRGERITQVGRQTSDLSITHVVFVARPIFASSCCNSLFCVQQLVVLFVVAQYFDGFQIGLVV